MAVQTQVVRFQKDNSGTAGVTQDVNLNFTPKAVIVFSIGSSLDNSNAGHYSLNMGFSDGINQCCVANVSRDGTGAADTYKLHSNDSVFVDLTVFGAVNARGTISFATNKVTFTWAVNALGATYVYLIAFSGDDITNVKVGSQELGTTSTGNLDITGLGFTPTDGQGVVFGLTSGLNTNAFSNTPNNDAGCSLGAAVSSLKRWVVANATEDTRDPTDTWCYYSNSNLFTGLDLTTGAVDWLADFVSWISDGFRINIVDAASNSTTKLSYMVIKGGTWDCGSLQSPTTATDNVDYPVVTGSNTIRGLMMATSGLGTLNTPSSNAIFSLGVTDTATQGQISIIDEDAALTTDSYRNQNITNIIKPITTNGATLEQATFDSFTTDNFRLDWNTANASQLYYGWVVVADSPPQSQLYEKTISESSISISEQLTRIQTRKFVLSETAISVNESLTRVPKYLKTINETAITLNETLARIAKYNKTVSEPSTNTNDSIARWISISHTLTEPSNSINDTIIGGLLYNVLLIESRIRWYYSLLTRKVPEGES